MINKYCCLLMLLLGASGHPSFAQSELQADSVFIKKLFDESLSNAKAYEWLRVLLPRLGAV